MHSCCMGHAGMDTSTRRDTHGHDYLYLLGSRHRCRACWRWGVLLAASPDQQAIQVRGANCDNLDHSSNAS